VVGLSCDANGNCRAFIWENGVMRDLNDFKPASYTARLEQARDVNEASEIAGRPLDSTGVRRAFLATPHCFSLSEKHRRCRLPPSNRQFFDKARLQDVP